MDNGNTSIGSGSLQISDMNQAWINTSQALAEVQAQAGNSIAQNSEGQYQVCQSMVTMSQNAMTQAINSYNTFLKEQQAEKHASFWQNFFEDFAGGLLAVLSFASGQPELGVMSVLLLVGQQTGETAKLENAICPNSAVGRLCIGLAIMVICTAVGGIGASAREGSVLGGTLMAGSQALGSVGLQSNIGSLVTSSKAALGISCALMAVALIGGLVGGKLTMGDADFSSLGSKMATLAKASPALLAAGQAGQSSAGIASGCFMYQESNALLSANQANAISSVVNDLRDEFSAQAGSYMQSMEQVATTAAKEGVAVARGMAKSNQWAAQLVAHA